jgi:hypothetical protein
MVTSKLLFIRVALALRRHCQYLYQIFTKWRTAEKSSHTSFSAFR